MVFIIGTSYDANFSSRCPPCRFLRLVEADRVGTPDLNAAAAANAVDGIVFDAAGNPVEYHVLKDHPGDGFHAVRDYDRVPADAVLHWFRADRPGQARGVPDILPLCRCSRNFGGSPWP
jgi:capsid protein